MHTHTTKNSRSDYFLLLLCLQTVSLHNTLLFLLFDYYFFWRFVVSSFFVLELTTRRLVFVWSAFINNELYRGWCRGWMDCCRVKAHRRTSTPVRQRVPVKRWMNTHTRLCFRWRHNLTPLCQEWWMRWCDTHYVSLSVADFTATWYTPARILRVRKTAKNKYKLCACLLKTVYLRDK